jgi:hypothetical protein
MGVRPAIMLSGLILSSCATSAEVVYRSAVASALAGHWARAREQPPRNVNLYLPRGLTVDTVAIRQDFGKWSAHLSLLDSSSYAQLPDTAGPPQMDRTIYSVRELTRAEWTKRWAQFVGNSSPAEAPPVVRGRVFQVTFQWCRGWPCHGETLVELRQRSGGYVLRQHLLWGVE